MKTTFKRLNSAEKKLKSLLWNTVTFWCSCCEDGDYSVIGCKGENMQSMCESDACAYDQEETCLDDLERL